MASEPKVFSITQLTRSIRNNLLANNPRLAGCWFEGEVSGCKLYSSGHAYFTLKDDAAAINCVLFSHCFRNADDAFSARLAAAPDKIPGDRANGLKVQVKGELDLNMSRGQYSFKVTALRLAGEGDRMKAFLALKARLDAEGLNKLDHPELRRRLPFLPHRIGIVTSPTGAVIHDMCTRLTGRFPNIQIRLWPAKVQGEGAAASIAAGVAFFQTDPWSPDLLIVGRGGGSTEDLWAFNEEPVVYAVARSRVPVISAVGHESDFTLCDTVADLRAGTPSIAAELAVPVARELRARVSDLGGRLASQVTARIDMLAQNVDYLSEKLAQAPGTRVLRLEGRLREAAGRLAVAPREAHARLALRLEKVSGRLLPAVAAARTAAETRLARLPPRLLACAVAAETARRRRLETAAARLSLLDPANTVKRGYTITLDEAGNVVKSAASLVSGTRLETRFAEGSVRSVVE